MQKKKIISIKEEYASFAGDSDQVYGHKTYAQFGEDLVICNIFSLLGIANPSYLDIGAHHPIKISNTALLYMRGSRGVNVEANPALHQEFVRLRPDDINLNFGIAVKEGMLDFYMVDELSGRNSFNKKAVESFIADFPEFSIRKIMPIQTIHIDKLIEKYCDGIYPQLLSIDVEGNDFDILQSANFSKSSPIVICAEEGLTNCGIDTIVGLLQSRGFRLYFRTQSNVIFIREDMLKKLFFE